LQSSTIWLIITFICLSLKTTDKFIYIKRSNHIDKNALIEFIKEKLNFWRNLIYGTFAGYVAILVTSLNEIHKMNNTIVTDERELFILNSSAHVQYCIFSIFLFVGVIYRIFRK
jgi:hypothetical protein